MLRAALDDHTKAGICVADAGVMRHIIIWVARDIAKHHACVCALELQFIVDRIKYKLYYLANASISHGILRT